MNRGKAPAVRGRGRVLRGRGPQDDPGRAVGSRAGSPSWPLTGALPRVGPMERGGPSVGRAAGEELLRRAREGDPEAFGELLEELRPRLLRQVERWIERHPGRTPGTAEDVVQEACLRAFRARHRVRAETRGCFDAWVQRIAHNRLRDLWSEERSERRALGRRRDLGEATSQPETRVGALGHEGDARLRASLWRLEGEERLVILLRELLELSWETTSLLLGRPSIKATRSLHARTRAKMARAWGSGQ